MPGRFAEVIEFRPRTARWLALFALGLAVLGGCALQWVALDTRWQLLLGLLVSLRLVVGLRRHLYPAASDYVGRAVMQASGDWQLELGGTRLVAARLRRSWGGLHGPMVGLEWTCVDGQACLAWLTALDMPASTWRRLRAHLSLG